MEKAIADVGEVIRLLLGKDYKIVVVHNASGRGRDAEVRYSVKMEYTAHSQEIRSKFGSFFAGGQDKRPDGLRSVSISNKITPGTQIRIMLLKLLAKRYETSNPGAKARVIGFEPRPLLRITPPATSSDRRIRTFTFIDAIRKLPTNFTTAEVRGIVAKARVHFANKLRSIFVVISDDIGRPTTSSTAGNVSEEVSVVEEEQEAGVVEEVLQGSRKRPNPDRDGPSGQRARR